MDKITEDIPYQKSKIIYTNFINAPASNYSTIKTAVLEAMRMSTAHGQNHTIVTFDQPLYIKAKDIVEANPEIYRHVVPRMGGLHLVFSYLGSIGYIMEGSGLQEVFSEIYAFKATEKMLSGHAYERAVRAHSIIHSALAQIIFSNIQLDDEELKYFKELSKNLNKDILNKDILNMLISPIFGKLVKKFTNKLEEMKKKGPTGALWVQYFDLVTLLKKYIESERSGNWSLQIECLKQMIPIFHASGHFFYAKCI